MDNFDSTLFDNSAAGGHAYISGGYHYTRIQRVTITRVTATQITTIDDLGRTIKWNKRTGLRVDSSVSNRSKLRPGTVYWDELYDVQLKNDIARQEEERYKDCADELLNENPNNKMWVVGNWAFVESVYNGEAYSYIKIFARNEDGVFKDVYTRGRLYSNIQDAFAAAAGIGSTAEEKVDRISLVLKEGVW